MRTSSKNYNDLIADKAFRTNLGPCIFLMYCMAFVSTLIITSTMASGLKAIFFTVTTLTPENQTLFP
jgi:hypothetical protein